MSVGPIPDSKIKGKARELDLDKENTQVFEAIIGVLDSWYMEWMRDSAPKSGRGPPPPTEPPGGWGSRSKSRG